ncbi:MAG: sulfurtransferase-like selenium metabolism protein YedF [Bacteroidales bacterium]|nr:sulfurtransferase-like selenium metabolism protein YedF [Bacteroidales bacterium]
MKTVDAQGKMCPMPLIMTKKALSEISENETLEILIDNETSVKNVSRFLEEHNMSISTEKQGKVFRLKVSKTGVILEETKAEDYCKTPMPVSSDYVIAIQKNKLGQGNDELGELLIKGFINTLPEIDNRPKSLVFMNSGIFLALKDSLVIDSLLKLEKEGVKILVCGTCLDYYKKKEELGVGIVSNMYDILNILSNAAKVLYP